MTTVTSSTPLRRSLKTVVSDLFSLGGENRPYSAVCAEDITRSAWEQTGQSLQYGMDCANDPDCLERYTSRHA
ncbi:hypothetical protein GFGA_1d1217 [Gluconobacter frateurii NBRC 103465]|nr:hypothetical protein GFGA_1d1217 [Gluconobacter frateurii NBRC 103465]